MAVHARAVQWKWVICYLPSSQVFERAVAWEQVWLCLLIDPPADRAYDPVDCGPGSERNVILIACAGWMCILWVAS